MFYFHGCPFKLLTSFSSATIVSYGKEHIPVQISKVEKLPLQRGKNIVDVNATVLKSLDRYALPIGANVFELPVQVLGLGDGKCKGFVWNFHFVTLTFCCSVCINLKIPSPKGYRFLEPVEAFRYVVDGCAASPFGISDRKYEGQPSIYIHTGDVFERDFIQQKYGRSDVKKPFEVLSPNCKPEEMSFPVQIIACQGSGNVSVELPLTCRCPEGTVYKLDVLVKIPFRAIGGAPGNLDAKVDQFSLNED